ncbi:MAG: hypothetical protein JWP01_1491 [Myxococcales bacterium]|nr:hypothetical protein [Myxococcales bacterium]
MTTTTMTVPATRLETIATRQQKSFVRDVVFAALVALAAVVSVSSVATAVHAASSPTQIGQIAQR